MSSAHREGGDEIQGKQWLRSCRKPNSICEALERNSGEAECCIASVAANSRLREQSTNIMLPVSSVPLDFSS